MTVRVYCRDWPECGCAHGCELPASRRRPSRFARLITLIKTLILPKDPS